MPDVPQCKQISEDFRVAFSRYNIKAEEIYTMIDDADPMQLRKIRKEIKNSLQLNKDKNILIVYIFIGHGI